MPTTIRRWKHNQLRQVDYGADSLAEANRYEPDGVYTVANTENTYDVLKLGAHLDRLLDSARREQITTTLTVEQMRAALREVIRLADYGDVRFRLTIPRAAPDELLVTVEPFGGQPEALYREGVQVMTAPNSARRNAAAKGTWWMTARKSLTETYDAYEIILMDKAEHLLEGATSNFYAILRDTLYTAIDGVLPGISQQVVFEVAPDILPLVRRPVRRADVPDLQEAFISSSSRGIVPVVEIDGQKLGDGKPGGYTRALMVAYGGWVTANLETV